MSDLQYGLNTSVGFIFDGVALSVMLYGITLGQVTYYFKTYQEDPPQMRLMVAILLGCETVKVAMNVKLFWLSLILHRADNFSFIRTLTIQTVFSYVVMFIVQCFYIFNIKIILARKWYCRPVIYFAVLLSVGSLVIGCTMVNYEAYNHPVNAFDVAGQTQMFALSSPIVTQAADVWIAASLCYGLYGARSGYDATRNILVRLIMYTANRSLLLCLLQAIQVVIWSLPVSSVHGATSLIYFPQSAVYLSSALAMLNVRRHIRSRKTFERTVTRRVVALRLTCEEPSAANNLTGIGEV
ncbi:uncharacterized protein B0H18DRAFT_1123950 [Fomitopsis serialis]|uniref:uncharacterized protein n=1 Tax=Fomitopsis serialis TaxID=139415 RepID=UPI0020079278|nr:uncharacterized protein B0H18DRAFT_1123950 [Neoantrodia serialis]KAH9916882.1 hypothetical protein B0H18DRAFT_1123950 [Neoantrodia serialis]